MKIYSKILHSDEGDFRILVKSFNFKDQGGVTCRIITNRTVKIFCLGLILAL